MLHHSDNLWSVAARLVSMLSRVLRMSVQHEVYGKESATFSEILSSGPVHNLPPYDDYLKDVTWKGSERPPSECTSIPESVDGESRSSWNGSIPALPSALEADCVALFYVSGQFCVGNHKRLHNHFFTDLLYAAFRRARV